MRDGNHKQRFGRSDEEDAIHSFATLWHHRRCNPVFYMHARYAKQMQPLLAVQAVPGKLALALASAQPGDAFQARERGPTGAGAGGKDASGTGAVTPVPSSCPAFSVIPSAPSPASAEAISNGA